jgi:hypothetical protein
MKKQLIPLAIGVIAAAGVSASAADFDLTTIPATAFVGGAYYNSIDPQSTGTGLIDPFLRLQNNGTEAGINNDGVQPFDEKSTHTHSITLGQLATVPNPADPNNGISYYQFILDANQIANGPALLTGLKIFTGGYINTVAGLQNLVSTGTPVYDLGANTIKVMSQNGSGSGDMSVLIPVGLFSGSSATDNLYLYSTFGGGDIPSNDGIEEWWAVLGEGGTPPSSVPDAGTTMMLLGMACVGIEGLRRKFQA